MIFHHTPNLEDKTKVENSNSESKSAPEYTTPFYEEWHRLIRQRNININYSKDGKLPYPKENYFF